jgi:hypothetical protein
LRAVGARLLRFGRGDLAQPAGKEQRLDSHALAHERESADVAIVRVRGGGVVVGMDDRRVRQRCRCVAMQLLAMPVLCAPLLCPRAARPKNAVRHHAACAGFEPLRVPGASHCECPDRAAARLPACAWSRLHVLWSWLCSCASCCSRRQRHTGGVRALARDGVRARERTGRRRGGRGRQARRAPHRVCVLVVVVLVAVLVAVLVLRVGRVGRACAAGRACAVGME